MFDEISPTYDMLNHVFSMRQDLRWRRKAIKKLNELEPSYKNILDLAAGTGDLTVELNKLSPNHLFAVDISLEMLKINREKMKSSQVHFVKADALHLPFNDNYFNLIGISFGIRNFEYLDKGLKEMRRVLDTNGKFLTIEMFRNPSKNFVLKSFLFYFNKIVPRIGNLLSRSKYAYNYLFRSVETFLSIDEYSKLLNENGFKLIYQKNNFLGIVHTVIAEKIS